MTFTQGQRVRIRGKQIVGTVGKKLTSLNDVYVVAIENASPNTERLARGADLEVVPDFEIQTTA
jgi:hypothetical protein